MTGPSRLRRAWRLFLRRSDVSRAVEEELALHLEMTTEELIAGGMDPASARRKAESMFGDAEAYRRACEEVGQRRRRKRQVRELVRDRAHDIRLTLRCLGRTPLFSALAILIIALGIGAVTTMYTIVKDVLLAPLPYSEPDRLVRITVYTANWGTSVSLSEPEYMALRTEARTLRDVTVVQSRSHLLQSEEPHYVRSVQTSWELFPLLGVAPMLGRTYTAADDKPGAEPVAVLSYTFWSGECGGDPELVGHSLTLDGTPYTVIGVMPAGFGFPDPEAAVWTPYKIDPANLNTWNNHYLGVYARLNDDATFADARAEVTTMGDRFVNDHPNIYSEWDFRLGARLLKEDVVGEVDATLLFLLGATCFFLLIACINVANLLVARGETRGREVAIRTALGASRRRITSMLLIEAGVLAAAGGVLGLILALLGVEGVVRASTDIVPRIQEVAIDPGILLFAVVVTGITGCLFGLLPVLRAGRFDVQAQLREAGRSLAGRQSGTRLRRWLIVVEVALSVVLVTGAIMMMRSLSNLQQFDLGYRTDDRLTMQVILPEFQEREEADIQNFYADLLDRIRALPGVENAAAIEYLPLSLSLGTWSIKVEGEGTTSIGDAPGSFFLQITPDFFSTMDIEVLAGRTFTRQDAADTRPVVIVNEAFVREHWPDGNALGRRIKLFDDEKPWLEVVGVVKDVHHESVLIDPDPIMYIPHKQGPTSSYESRWWMTVVIHGSGAAELTGPVRSIIREKEPDAVINNVHMMDEVHRAALADRTLPTSLLTLFSSLALLLAAVGVYGLTAFLAAARRTEFGLHIALGALPADIRRLVVTQGLYPVLVGVFCGLSAAYALGGLFQQFLFGIGRLDPVSFLIVAGLLTVVALIAGFVPALRSARVDPMQVLKME